jgi:hypothetical protein
MSSNETKWPWYTNVAPMSWLVQHDVADGRATMNFSEWGQSMPQPDEVAGAVEGGSMPPLQYKLIHSGGRLNDQERTQLASALSQMTGSSG